MGKISRTALLGDSCVMKCMISEMSLVWLWNVLWVCGNLKMDQKTYSLGKDRIEIHKFCYIFHTIIFVSRLL